MLGLPQLLVNDKELPKVPLFHATKGKGLNIKITREKRWKICYPR